MPRIANRPDAEATNKLLSRRVLVTIRRGQTTDTPRVVWAHEVPVLQVIHGEDEVKEADPKSMDEGYTPTPSANTLHFNKAQDRIAPPSSSAGLGWVFTGNAEAEFERMVAAYGRHVDVNQPNVEYVYGRFATGKFSQVVGKPELEDLPDSQLRDMVLNWGYALPVATKDSTREEFDAAAKAWRDFNALDHAALVSLAERTGVQIG